VEVFVNPLQDTWRQAQTLVPESGEPSVQIASRALSSEVLIAG